MSDISRVSTGGALPYGGIGQGSAIQDATLQKTREALEVIQEFHPQALGLGKTPGTTPGNTGLVSNANGAPQLGDVTLTFSPDDLVAALVVLQNKTQEAQLATARNGLTTHGRKREEATQRSLDKIKDWVDKCKSAAAKSKAGGILGWFKKAFTVVAAVFAVAVASIATVASGGVAAPLLALAVLGMAAAITSLASEISKATGHKGFDHVSQWMDPAALFGRGVGEFAKTLGASDKDAAIVSASFTAVMTVVIIAASVALTGGASASRELGNLSQTVMTVSRIGQSVTGVAGGATQAAQGALNIAVAQDQRAAAVIQSDQKNIDATIARLQQQMEEGREDIKKVMDEIMEGMHIVSQMINASHANRAQITSNLTGRGQAI